MPFAFVPFDLVGVLRLCAFWLPIQAHTARQHGLLSRETFDRTSLQARYAALPVLFAVYGKYAQAVLCGVIHHEMQGVSHAICTQEMIWFSYLE